MYFYSTGDRQESCDELVIHFKALEEHKHAH